MRKTACSRLHGAGHDEKTDGPALRVLPALDLGAANCGTVVLLHAKAQSAAQSGSCCAVHCGAVVFQQVSVSVHCGAVDLHRVLDVVFIEKL